VYERGTPPGRLASERSVLYFVFLRMTTQIRASSKSLFGNLYMLEVCSAIAEAFPERVSLMVLVGETSVSPSVYTSPLRRLVHGGFLRDVGHDEGDHRTRWYEPQPSPLWKAARDLHQSIEADQ